MIFSFAAIMLICLVVAIRAEDRAVRIAFLAFFLLNLLAGIVTIMEGNAFKFLPPDPYDEPAIYRW